MRSSGCHNYFAVSGESLQGALHDGITVSVRRVASVTVTVPAVRVTVPAVTVAWGRGSEGDVASVGAVCATEVVTVSCAQKPLKIEVAETTSC